ncbi:serine/threonine-protein kinase OXI1-like [Pyrus ussuriensis x Pyrus communis]|uniref:Serine/threonine-protein kinase OXI1-like n=1 Tax=Pyrus ussuriensis x Pyrus communis TaxID=2448454 RepID=A0A5N5HP48_9ROSA|nr:serine/threonine-protein kinase OXI1-like [Pyrus ussuriensis x Pyrus communis]
MDTVFLVHDPSSDSSARCPFALKVVGKSTLRSKLDVLTRPSSPNPHPFLPSIMGSFEFDEFMGWVVPYYLVFEVSRASSAS